MSEQTDIREFLRRMADETGFASVEPRPVVRKARRRLAFTVGGTLLTVAALVAGALVGVDRLMTADPTPRPAGPGPTVSAPSTGVGGIGLPPPEADPSSPERGELVITYYGRPGTGVGETYVTLPSAYGLLQVLVYADGRVIWRREGISDGANGIWTGFFEQRLTPQGLEHLRTEVVSSGLFDRDRSFHAWSNNAEIPQASREEGLLWGSIRVQDGERVVSLWWGWGRADSVDPTPQQARTVRRLNDLFFDPASVLPASAWEDPRVKAYVPSGYAICYSRESADLELSEALNHLPTRAQDLLLGRDRTYKPMITLNGGGGNRQVCSEVTTEEARLLEEILVDAGAQRGHYLSVLEYRVPAPAPTELVLVQFHPVLPHGHWSLFPG